MNYFAPTCCAIKLDETGQPEILPSGERLCCTRREGHSYPHADRDDDGNLVEWQ